MSSAITLYFRLFIFTLFFSLSGCSTTPGDREQVQGETQESDDFSDSRDPFEAINRPFWTFTWDYVDAYIAKPASEVYTTYTPPFLRTGLYNIALNLNEPASIINNVLQLKFEAAAKNTGRFVLNSTIGLFGFYDPASDFDWSGEQEEFGEVLGSYGVGDGPYIVIPGLGPSSVREEVGDYVDSLYWPMVVIDFWPNIARLGILALEKRAAVRDQEQLVVESEDPYEFIKNAYFQNMNYKLFDGNPPIIINETEEDELDALLDEFDDMD
ncbi:VacJ family lipoprotein [Colwellia psychrerythraea]|uniref:VacJ family lipoprotein n=1 Tax=Colwellia psychrerythraea TaxID=28229 RepID=A0A099L272_COLPS|nr:VacJ family lipoprotein [Colwellia psychrerythraea]KGJ97049.1 VacJ family lipoprotein [Colwellia psychrerythraea]